MQQRGRQTGGSRLDASAREQWVYITKGNELLQDIALDYAVSVNDIIRVNPGVHNVYNPPSGTALIIPLDKANEVFKARLGQHIQDKSRGRLIRWSTMPRGQVAGAQVKRSASAPLQLSGFAAQLAAIIREKEGSKYPVDTAVLQRIARPMEDAMQQAGVNTPLRKAAFIAQVAKETERFKYLKEYGGDKYFKDRGYGNKWKGRGFFHLTLQINYAEADKYLASLGVIKAGELLADPDLASEDKYNIPITVWYWTRYKGDLNAFADEGKIDAISRKIYGNYKSLTAEMKASYAERVAFYDAAKRVLGAQ